MIARRDASDSHADWLEVGSIKPDDASVPVRIRSKSIALALCLRLLIQRESPKNIVTNTMRTLNSPN